MGYRTVVAGEITITPPLTQAEMEAVDVVSRHHYLPERWIGTTRRHNRDEEVLDIAVRVEIDAHYEGDELRTTITGVALVGSWDDEFKAYYIEEDLQTMVNTFPDHSFSGSLLLEGEDNLDIWRLAVHNGHDVVVLRPKLVWPDGTEEVYDE